ncbi:hypothetical protein JM93_03158 [Roseibium hamelinense]|uniref:DUF3102 family protein n=1 Tax=Roseibium hamelinense TaxID=150831 RepID=A0A562SU44_9HYPH|nr:hypothetical protein [Roseibium hamelinense]MTI42535.1 hypothetical protein [Roseibium hamelinense]TWI84821.1 hypothetical protein JM93_03158 [Roseibium hamelinense]
MTAVSNPVEIDALDSDARARVEAIGIDILGLGKKDTETTFKLGALLEEASELIGDEKVCDGWLISHLGITARHGRNLRAVHRNLTPYKAKCVKLGVTPTNLYKIAHAEAESIQTVLQLYESGKRPLGQDVDAIVKRKADAEAIDLPIEDRPGLNGLARYGAQEQRVRIARLKELLHHILLHIVEAYEPKLRGRAVIKSHLREKIRLESEEARKLLRSMIGFFRRPDDWAAAIGHLHLENPENAGGWVKLIHTLDQLQYIENVLSKKLPDFLNDTAIQQLKWALGLEDKFIADLFKKAAEKNAPDATKKSGKKAPVKSRPEKTELPVEGDPSPTGQQAEKSKFQRPDFLKKAAEKAV